MAVVSQLLLLLPSMVASVPNLHSSGLSSAVECEVCKTAVQSLDAIVRSDQTYDTISELANLVCPPIAFKINECGPEPNTWQCKDVCEGMVRTFEPLGIDIVASFYLSPQRVCSLPSLAYCPTLAPTVSPTAPANTLYDSWPRTKEHDIGYILQIPDVHWDPLYTENTVENCGEPVCCRAIDNQHSSDVTHPSYSGKFGSYQLCDTSNITFQSMFDYINEQFSPVSGVSGKTVDFTIWVGDAPTHDVWNETRESKAAKIDYVMSKLMAELPPASESVSEPVVFPVVGNHEAFPINQFAGHQTLDASDTWLYSTMSSNSESSLNNEWTTKDTLNPSDMFTFAGFYTTLIRPGLRIVTINTGLIMDGNTYREYADGLSESSRFRDMSGQLIWLNDTLNQARKLKETVWFLQHCPFSSSPNALAEKYLSLLQEFKDIIQYFFAGHSHSDEWHILRENYQDSIPLGVQWIVGSVTTYGGRNPQFRLWKYNRTDHTLLDFTQYRMNISQSNELGKPIWGVGYSMREEYGLTEQQFGSPQGWLSFTESLFDNDRLWHRFQYNLRGGYDYGFDKLDRNQTVCHLLTPDDAQFQECLETHPESLYRWKHDPNNPLFH